MRVKRYTNYTYVPSAYGVNKHTYVITMYLCIYAHIFITLNTFCTQQFELQPVSMKYTKPEQYLQIDPFNLDIIFISLTFLKKI